MSDLLPCPFCGTKPREFVGGSHGGVDCSGCQATIDHTDEKTHDPYVGLESAKRAWNRRAPEARAEGQSPAERPLTVTEETGAESEPAVDLLRATVNRLMGERDALADALRRIAGGDIDDRSLVTNADVLLAYQRVASAALAQLDSVAPPLTPND